MLELELGNIVEEATDAIVNSTNLNIDLSGELQMYYLLHEKCVEISISVSANQLRYLIAFWN